ncbi:MAG TPA: tetratricopeptide repeat protein [Kofleriaceae bacterium]|nr:tetratricopeptide repeat protein [Kofleriaceae bacterium]
MRGTAPAPTVDLLAKAMRDEFPELDPERLRVAVERAAAKAAAAALNTEGHRFIDLHLQRVESAQEATERARILRDLSEDLEDERGDSERAMVVRLAAFAEAPNAADVDPLLRLAKITQRFTELPLDAMVRAVDPMDDAAPRLLNDIAAAWQQMNDPYRAADCLERVLAIAPGDVRAHDALELFYRSTREWPSLIELLRRRVLHVEAREQAELLREIGQTYERELGDDAGALDAYREAEGLAPGHPDVLDALGRLIVRLGEPDEEALVALERLAKLVDEPRKRASVLFRAADIAKTHSYDRAQALYERARADDPDLVPAIDGLAVLLRDRGNLAAVVALLIEAAARPSLASERSRWLADAADFCVALGDTDRAKQLYKEAREADPANHKAAVALVELCWDTGSLVEIAPILDELCRVTQEPGRLRRYLVERSKVATELGDAAASRDALARAVELDPHDPQTRRELADMMFEAGDWLRARQLIEGLLDDNEDLLQAETAIELHYRVARCAFQLGDKDGAAKHAAVTLALRPDHREALLLRAELDVVDPQQQLADQLALANIAAPEEKGVRFAALGDRYAELGDRATAREMYREALQYRRSDHLLLTKFLGLVADDGDWSYSLDLVRRLIDTEQDPKVRARYRHLAAMIARDELELHDDAIALLDQAIEDDKLLFSAADELEAMLSLATDREALATFYYRRLGHVRDDEGRKGERLRLWDRLGELCQQLGRPEDAVTAFEVGLSLDPDDLERRQRLADLYLDADPKHDQDAIGHHQAILRMDRRRLASYEALRTLYRRTGQHHKARAVDEALAIIGMRVYEQKIDALFGRPAEAERTSGRWVVVDAPVARALANEDWLALSRLDVDLQLSALFALASPAFAAERARLRPPPPQAPSPELPSPVSRVIGEVATVFGIAAPGCVIDRDQPIACTLALRLRDGGALVPALVLGRPVVDDLLDDGELAFHVARQLADLRSDRIARLYCSRPGDLAQVIELAMAGADDPSRSAARWLATSLHGLELEQALAIGARLRDRGVDPARAARDWLAATDRAGDRIGFVVIGDLATAHRVIEREPGGADRVLDLVWSSVTEEVLAVRGRVEGWRAGPPRPPMLA